MIIGSSSDLAIKGRKRRQRPHGFSAHSKDRLPAAITRTSAPKLSFFSTRHRRCARSPRYSHADEYKSTPVEAIFVSARVQTGANAHVDHSNQQKKTMISQLRVGAPHQTKSSTAERTRRTHAPPCRRLTSDVHYNTTKTPTGGALHARSSQPHAFLATQHFTPPPTPRRF